jgi:short-subunit dehydrogenase
MKNSVVIITGASSGIGLACVYEFAAQGANIVMAARSIDTLKGVEKDLTDKGVACMAVQTDVSIESDCKNLIEKAVERFHRIDILINNAGLSMRAGFKDVDLSVLKKLMDVNFWGTVYCTKYALPYLLKAKGSVVGVSSIAGFIGLPGRTGYSASKFAMNGFLETVRTENLKSGLHVLIVAPGFTASNVRKAALTSDGSSQGETPRKEEKMMSAERVAYKMRRAIEKRKNKLILTFVEGKLTVFLTKFFPSFVASMSYNMMLKEPDSPLKNG